MKIALSSIIFLLLAAFSVQAETDSPKTLALQLLFNTAREWHVTAIESGDSPVNTCFWVLPEEKSKQCIPSLIRIPGSHTEYAASILKDLSVRPHPHLIQSVTQFYGSGSGILTQVTFWRYDKPSDVFIQAGQVTVTEQGEYILNNKGILITANAYWQQDETHFAPHQFYIDAYSYDPKRGFKKVLHYLTKEKYPSLDNVEKINVISYEMPKIQSGFSN